MKIGYILMGITLFFLSCAQSQEDKDYQLVGGPCEGCEAVFEYGDQKLNSIDTLPDFTGAKNKLKISGIIYELDGKTPAENVILYIYHTNAKGVYPTKGDEEGWGKRHGYIRGWIKTGKDGNYTFYTQIPGSYPNRKTPAHIHPLILQPDGKYYYINEYLFANDPRLTKDVVNEDFRGGNSGVLELKLDDGISNAHRDIILGKNIPGYKD